MKLVIQIAAGILLAAAIAIFVGYQLTIETAKTATTTLHRAASEARATQVRKDAERAVEQEMKAREAEKRRATEAALRRAKATAEAERQAAWRAYYRPRPECDSPPTWDAQVECTNEGMRARKRFEETYVPGP